MFLTVGFVLFAQNEKNVLGLRHGENGVLCSTTFSINSLCGSVAKYQSRVNKVKNTKLSTHQTHYIHIVQHILICTWLILQGA